MFSKFRAALLCTLALVTAVAHAATLTVGVGYTYSTIQSAINAASDGDVVAVYANPAIYTENIDFKGKAITVMNAATSGTITIQGTGAGPTVSIVGPFASTTSKPTLNRFIVQGGGIPQTSGGPYGGVYILNAGNVNLYANTILGNGCTGIVSINSTPSFSANEVAFTKALSGCPSGEGKGSAIFISGGTGGLIMGGQIHDNTASTAANDNGGGAGINLLNVPSISIANNSIFNNTSAGYGGGIYAGNSPSLSITGNLLYNNKGISGGMDLVIPGSTVGPINGVIANNTLADNTGSGTNSASDLYIGGNLAQYVIINNIIVGYANGQTALNCGSQYAKQTITPLVFDHNDILAYAGTSAIAIGGACTSPAGSFGNISADPKFISATPAAVAAGTANFQLNPGSPAIDTGDNNILAFAFTNLTDLNGVTRPLDATNLGYRVIDMGAYEAAGSTNEGIGTELTITPSAYSPTAGSTVTITANLVTPSVKPTGAVTFYEDGTAIGTVSGTGGYFITLQITAGLHSFYATYAGSDPPATSLQLYLLVGTAKATVTNTTLTSSLNPSNLGNSVTFTAHVTAVDATVPTGTVYFTDGAVSLGPGVVLDSSGNATLTTATLTAGSHSLVAAFVPTGNYAGSTGSLTQIVNGAASSAILTVSPTSAAYGAPITLTATVSPATPPGPSAPAGTVNFLVDGGTTGTVTLSPATAMQSVASEILRSLPAGPHTITCTYSGEANYAPTNCNSVSVTITAAASSLTLTSSLNPAPSLAAITFTAALTANGQPAPAGNTITLTIGANAPVTLTTNASGIATYTISTLTTGVYPVTANFAASKSLLASSASLTQTVTALATTLSLTSTPNPAYQGQTVTLTANLSPPNPLLTGLPVTFFDGAASIGTAALSPTGQATLTTTTLTVGTHALSASFAGNTTFLAATSTTIQQVILPSSFTLSLAPPALTIAQGHAGNTQVILTSIGVYTGPLTLTYGKLPPYATATISPSTVTLPAGGAIAATLQITTAMRVRNEVPTRPGSRTLPIAFAALLLLLPLGRNKRPITRLTLALAFVALQSITGCTNSYYTEPTVAAGTYQIPITATDPNHNTQTTTLTITVP
jgi:hypothetical protein